MSEAEEFMQRFAGLDRAYGTYKITGRNANKNKVDGEAFTVSKPPTVELWKNHLAGKQGIGIVPICSDSTCLWGAIDIDDYNLDINALEKKIAELDLPLILCRTKSGGAHLYLFLLHPVAAKKIREILANWAAALGFPGVEVFPKQDNLAEGETGNWLNMPYFDSARTTRYCIKDGKAINAQEFITYAKAMAVDEADLKECPADNTVKPVNKIPQNKTPVNIAEGSRNSTLTSKAGSMRAKGFAPDVIEIALLAENEAHCNPPLSEKEVRGIVKSIMRYEEGEAKGYRFNDVGNASRLVDRFGANLRYLHTAKKWIGWNEQRWVFDEDGGIMRRAKDTALSIYQDAAKEKDDQRRQVISKWANQCENKGRLKSMVELAEVELPIAPNELDSDPWLLGCINGVLDLKTGKLREAKREDFITKMAHVEYDPSATCPRWELFLNQIMDGNKDLIAFLQRATGYTLTGLTVEQVLIFLIGLGANGKSVFQQVLQSLLGDYA